ncbi:unnamed protein product [Amoebophrya sp. A120]|nr:unnamed protein product [Amoebophrya sp. A120]|eukprot:GSA120T00021171001.1
MLKMTKLKDASMSDVILKHVKSQLLWSKGMDKYEVLRALHTRFAADPSEQIDWDLFDRIGGPRAGGQQHATVLNASRTAEEKERGQGSRVEVQQEKRRSEDEQNAASPRGPADETTGKNDDPTARFEQDVKHLTSMLKMMKLKDAGMSDVILKQHVKSQLLWSKGMDKYDALRALHRKFAADPSKQINWDLFDRIAGRAGGQQHARVLKSSTAQAKDHGHLQRSLVVVPQENKRDEDEQKNADLKPQKGDVLEEGPVGGSSSSDTTTRPAETAALKSGNKSAWSSRFEKNVADLVCMLKTLKLKNANMDDDAMKILMATTLLNTDGMHKANALKTLRDKYAADPSEQIDWDRFNRIEDHAGDVHAGAAEQEGGPQGHNPQQNAVLSATETTIQGAAPAGEVETQLGTTIKQGDTSLVKDEDKSTNEREPPVVADEETNDPGVVAVALVALLREMQLKNANMDDSAIKECVANYIEIKKQVGNNKQGETSTVKDEDKSTSEHEAPVVDVGTVLSACTSRPEQPVVQPDEETSNDPDEDAELAAMLKELGVKEHMTTRDGLIFAKCGKKKQLMAFRLPGNRQIPPCFFGCSSSAVETKLALVAMLKELGVKDNVTNLLKDAAETLTKCGKEKQKAAILLRDKYAPEKQIPPWVLGCSSSAVGAAAADSAGSTASRVASSPGGGVPLLASAEDRDKKELPGEKEYPYVKDVTWHGTGKVSMDVVGAPPRKRHKQSDSCTVKDDKAASSGDGTTAPGTGTGAAPPSSGRSSENLEHGRRSEWSRQKMPLLTNKTLTKEALKDESLARSSRERLSCSKNAPPVAYHLRWTPAAAPGQPGQHITEADRDKFATNELAEIRDSRAAGLAKLYLVGRPGPASTSGGRFLSAAQELNLQLTNDPSSAAPAPDSVRP